METCIKVILKITNFLGLASLPIAMGDSIKDNGRITSCMERANLVG